MSKAYVGSRVQSVDIGEELQTISRVIIVVDSDRVYTAGDDTGRTIERECPWGSQEMADALLQKLSAVAYKPFSAERAMLSPAFEIGDPVTIGGVYSQIVGADINYDVSGLVDIYAPDLDVTDDEYPAEKTQQSSITREFAKTRSDISKTAEQIRLEVIGEIVDKDGNPMSVASAITQTAEDITMEVSETIGDLGKDNNGDPHTVASKIAQTADEIRLEVWGDGGVQETSIIAQLGLFETNVKGAIGTDDNGDLISVSSSIEQTADAIRLEIWGEDGVQTTSIVAQLGSITASVEGALGTDKDGNLITVSNSIETALEGITLQASSSEGSTTLQIKSGETVLDTKTLKLSVDAAYINGSIYADALHLSGMLTIYSGEYEWGQYGSDLIETIGGYIGYDSGYHGYSSGIGIRAVGERSQMVCTEYAVRMSYSDDDGWKITQVVCGQDLALSSVGSIQFSIGGNVSNVVAGIDDESFYPADSSLTLGTKFTPWADVYVGDTSFAALVTRVAALEAAAKS